MIDEKKKVQSEITEELGPYHFVIGKFETYRYPGESRLLDTNVTISVPEYCITWSQKEQMMREIAEVLKKYLI